MAGHYALIPDAARDAVLTAQGSLPTVEAAGIRTAMVVDALERELGVDAAFLRTSAAVVDERGKIAAALAEFDAPRTPPRGEWIPLDEAVALVPAELAPAATRWVAEQRGEPIPRERAPWARPGWLAEAERWIAGRVGVLARPRLHAQWPLSSVLRVRTPDGVVYFKAAFPLFRHEPVVTAALAQAHPGLTPDVVAVEPDRGWLLMRELEGEPLGHLDRSRWPEAVPLLRDVHRTWSSRRDDVLALGAVDRGLDTLDVPDGLRPHLDRLHELAWPESLVHGDFHPWNVVVGGGRHRLYDWSDACWSHPLFDLLTYGHDEDRPAVLASYGVSSETFAVVEPPACIHHAISYERILAAMEPSDRWIFADVPRQLRDAAFEKASQPG